MAASRPFPRVVSISTTNDQSEDIGKISPEPRLKISILVFSLISSRASLDKDELV